MGYKYICLDCRKAFNLGTGFNNTKVANCPEYGVLMKLMDHKFKPPKKGDLKKWQVVKYLAENGFIYQHVYKKTEIESNIIVSYQNYTSYPETLKEAKDFVEKYKAQAIRK